MANLTSTADIKRQILKNCGELTDGGSPYDEDGTVLGHMIDAYLKVCGASNPYDIDIGEPWAWAKSKYPLIVNLAVKYETGSISLTNNSTAASFSAGPAASQAGKFIKVTARPDWIRIASHTAAATAFTLDAAYAGETGSGLGYKAIQLDYDIGTSSSRILRLIGPFSTEHDQMAEDQNSGKIHSLDQRSFSNAWPFSAIAERIPTKFTVIHESEGVQTIRFNGFPSAATRCEVEWIPIPADLVDSDQSIPIIPREHRCVLEYLGTYRLMLDKEDTKAQAYLDMGRAELKSMQTGKRKIDHQSGGQRGQLIPRADLANRRSGSFRFGR